MQLFHHPVLERLTGTIGDSRILPQSLRIDGPGCSLYVFFPLRSALFLAVGDIGLISRLDDRMR